MANKNPTFGQQPNLLLSRIFTGHPVGSPAMGSAALNAVVVGPTTDASGRPAVEVLVGGFGQTSATDSNVAGFVCLYEPRYGSHSTPQTPPGGTQCIVSFLTNGSPVPNKAGASGVVLAFLGWPT